MTSRVAEFRRDNPELFSSMCDDISGIADRAISYMADGDLASLGKCMRENQIHLRRVGVSNAILDSMILDAECAGYGAKITGAGGGGCIVSITDEGSMGMMVERLKEQGHDAFPALVDHTGLKVSCLPT